MKKDYLRKFNFILIFSLSLIMLCSLNVFATETSEVYLNWQELSDEEKENSIMPLPYVSTIDEVEIYDDISMFSRFTVDIGTTLANKYDLRGVESGTNVRIKDQHATDECWAFSTSTILETNAQKVLNKDIEISPRHIDYATSRTFLDGVNEKGYNREIGFGNYYVSLSYCTSGVGPVLESDMPFVNNKDKVNLDEIDKKAVLKIEDYIEFPDIYKIYNDSGSIIYTNGGVSGKTYTSTQITNIRESMKQHIIDYGAITAYMYVGQDILNDPIYMNNKKVSQGLTDTYAYFNKDSTKAFNHGITIIGWDDTYSKDNFNDNCKPSSDGAYIVLNSSGVNGKLSIIYVSYEDIWIEFGNFGIVKTNDIDYDNLYQYDPYGFSYALPLISSGKYVTSVYASNVFTRDTSKTEYLNEISIYVPDEQEIDIYVNASDGDNTKLQKVASAGILGIGYHTIKFESPIKLTGTKFVVAAKISDAGGVQIACETNYLTNGDSSNFWDYATSNEGESFVSISGKNWQDLTTIINDSNICIKAFTSYNETTEEPEQPEEPVQFKKGDVNKDGKISITDLAIVNKVLLEKTTLTYEQQELADLNNDGKVSITDLVIINKILLGFIKV